MVVGTSVVWDVNPDSLRVMGIRVVRGRDFLASEGGRLPSVIIDETAAHWLWPGANPVGRLIRFASEVRHDVPWIRVVGVMPPIALESFCDGGPCGVPTFLIANETGFPAPASESDFILRTTGPAQPVIDRLQALLTTDYPNTAPDVATWSVRIALGAQKRDIVRLVLREGNATALLGPAIGLLVANWVEHLLASFLFGYDDVAVLFMVGAVVTLFAATVMAGVPPLCERPA